MRDDVSDSVAGAAVGLVIIVAGVLVTGFLVLLFIAGGWLLKALLTHARKPAADKAAPTDWLGLPAAPRWLRAYDIWLYRLEQYTGIAFVATGLGIITGALIVAAGPALIVGSLLALVDPLHGQFWLLGLGATSSIIGTVSGLKLAQPVPWFSAGHSAAVRPISDGGFRLGDEL